MNELYGNVEQPETMAQPEAPEVADDGLDADDAFLESQEDDAEEGDKSYGLYGDGPQQGTYELADEQHGLYSDGPEQGTTAMDEPGQLHSDDPLGQPEP